MEYFLKPEELIDRIREMLKEFSAAQSALIRQDPHEDAIVDALGPFLHNHFSGFPYNINHNYDLMHSGDELVRKTSEFLRSELPKNKIPKKALANQENITKYILPDFILHDLMSGAHNFLFIEVKKSTNTNQDDRTWDKLKLIAATTGNLNYTYSCFIDIACGDDTKQGMPSDFVLFAKGKVIYHELG